jgi:hypothetical protein
VSSNAPQRIDVAGPEQAAEATSLDSSVGGGSRAGDEPDADPEAAAECDPADTAKADPEAIDVANAQSDPARITARYLLPFLTSSASRRRPETPAIQVPRQTGR